MIQNYHAIPAEYHSLAATSLPSDWALKLIKSNELHTVATREDCEKQYAQHRTDTGILPNAPGFLWINFENHETDMLVVRENETADARYHVYTIQDMASPTGKADLADAVRAKIVSHTEQTTDGWLMLDAVGDIVNDVQQMRANQVQRPGNQHSQYR